MNHKRRILWQDLRYTLWFPVYFLIYLALEKLISTVHWSTQTPLDHFIPFCEWFLIPYALWYPLLISIGIYLFLHDSNAFRRYMSFLSATFFLSELIWLLFPNGQNLRPLIMPRENPLTFVIELIYRADTCTNVFPSVHVVGSIGAVLAVWDCNLLRQKHRQICYIISILGILICLSTVFIKQHALLDVFSGVALSSAIAVPVYRHNLSIRHLRTKKA